MPRRLLASGYWMALIGSLMILPTIGCGSGRPPTFAVTGTVTYRGKPVEGALVMFVPKGSRPASGQTDAEGRFTLLSFKPGDGAVIGEHVVCVAKAASDPSGKGVAIPLDRKVVSLLPERYSTPLKSPLRATIIKDGPNDFRFDLTD